MLQDFILLLFSLISFFLKELFLIQCLIFLISLLIKSICFNHLKYLKNIPIAKLYPYTSSKFILATLEIYLLSLR